MINKTEKFIDKANKIHNHIYDYSLVNYQHSHNKIICTIHGLFNQTPTNHLSGYNIVSIWEYDWNCNYEIT